MDGMRIVAECPEFTVAAEPMVKYRTRTQYQSEADMERELIEQLQTQAYEYLSITSEAELVANLRRQLELLNDYSFTDAEWTRFFDSSIANKTDGIVEKTFKIQEDYIQLLACDDGTTKNIYLIDKKNIHNNHLQVINQYVPEGGARSNRYDVTILVNGLPLVHVELKRRGVSIKEAFNQINRYNRDSFWAGLGLFEYVQIFVISNGTQTKYYSNTTRSAHIAEVNKRKNTSRRQTSNSFEFTSYWALRNNTILSDLDDFTATFLSKHTLLNVLTKYCVLTSERLLLVMRPYQIAATESILQKIKVSTNYKKYGTIDGGGYVWHTTGSGKTLTSFKTARLASAMEGVDKVVFVVDRKDLDYQTMKEYDRFEKGAANSNTNTEILNRQLSDADTKIIITTIQKLSKLVNKYQRHAAYGKHIVFIFDECHRSQFGEMHAAIVKRFKMYHLFGFTGTPIFAQNAGSGSRFDLRTTEQAFGEKLHTYTIVDAISDNNVLPFRIDYISTMREQEDIKDEKVRNIDRERALMSKERISRITTYILDNFDRKTKRNDGGYYVFNRLLNISDVASIKKNQTVEEVKEKSRLNGFNSIFAVSSIEAARLYYDEFKRQMADLPEIKRLKVATIFSYGANEAVDDWGDEENSDSTDGLDQSSRDFLESAIDDYNQMFGTSYDTSSDKFPNYYKDVSLRMKNREIDMLIVVNMFLTGFDATTLNTLWVDKNLRMHGLLQAFSRTNRILNSVKTFGNIVCFRNLETATNESIGLFGDKEASGLVLLKAYDDYYYGYTDEKGKAHPGYRDLVDKLLADYPLGTRIVSEKAKKEFVKLYGAILKAVNILSSFDQFAGNEMLSPFDMQDYHSIYIDIYDEFRKQDKGDKANVNDDIIFEMELIKQVEINIDYILYLVALLHEDHVRDKEIKLTIQKAVDSSPELRNKKELIEAFIEQSIPGSEITDAWSEFVKERQRAELDAIIESENLKEEATYVFMELSYRNGEIQESGTEIAKILPPMSLFAKDGARAQKKESVLTKLKAFFDKFFDISGGIFEVSTRDNEKN
ncbi:MAG: type I restriction endonuclease subunit R [Paludibacteraceae bacterium]|nr:type I restriction endonuclease subunit R [Paludibacteraceae bacterium]